MTPIFLVLVCCAAAPRPVDRNAATAAEADATYRAAVVSNPSVAQPAQQPDLRQQETSADTLPATEPVPLPAHSTTPPVSDRQRRIATSQEPPPAPAPSASNCRTYQLQQVQHRPYTVRQPDGSVAVQAELVVTDSRPLRVCLPAGK